MALRATWSRANVAWQVCGLDREGSLHRRLSRGIAASCCRLTELSAPLWVRTDIESGKTGAR